MNVHGTDTPREYHAERGRWMMRLLGSDSWSITCACGEHIGVVTAHWSDQMVHVTLYMSDVGLVLRRNKTVDYFDATHENTPSSELS